MHLEGLIICVDYGDILGITLPLNKDHFDDLLIITTPKDKKTKFVCESNGVKYLETTSFYDNNSKFNKGKALNFGIKNLSRQDWILILDADIILPNDFSEKINKKKLDDETIYGCYRRFCPTPIKYNPTWRIDKYSLIRMKWVWAPGFFQLFNYNVSILKNKYSLYIEFPELGMGNDGRFSKQFKKREIFDSDYISVLHLGRAKENRPNRKGAKWDTHIPKKERKNCEFAYEIRVFSMKRSGHHAIINWIIEQNKGPVVFGNQCRIKEDGNEKKIIEGRKYYYHKDISSTFKNHKDLFIYNFEDVELSKVSNLFNFRSRLIKGGVSYNVLIIRDPFNLFASRKKLKEKKNNADCESNKKIIELWKKHAKEALLNHPKFTLMKLIIINYNKWFVDKEYRKQISDSLNLKFDDLGFETVPKFGGGSSFDRLGFNGKANKMKVLDRWREFIYDDDYWELLSDSELNDLSYKLFGFYIGRQTDEKGKPYKISIVKDQSKETLNIVGQSNFILKDNEINNVLKREMIY